MGPRIDADGCVRFVELGGIFEWASVHELAVDYWVWQRLSPRARTEGSSAAWSCVTELLWIPISESLDVIEALLALADTDQELCNIGAGPLEDLLSHSGYGATFVDDVVRRAYESSALRRALSCLWLSADVPVAVRRKLEPSSRWH